MAVYQTWVQIRERSFLDLLDLALTVVRERPLLLGTTAFLGVLPFALFNAWLLSLPNFPPAAVIYLLMLQAPWATAPLTVMLGGLMFGERPTAWRIVKTLARSIIPMFFFHGFIRGLLLLCVFFYPLVPTRLAFVNEVILLERGRWRSVYRRTANLTEQRAGDLFGQWLAQLFFGGLFVVAFWLGTGAILQTLFSSEVTWEPRWSDTFDLRTQLAIWVAVTFFGVVRFLVYLDQRIRLEGWEIELRLRTVGRALEADRKW